MRQEARISRSAAPLLSMLLVVACGDTGAADSGPVDSGPVHVTLPPGAACTGDADCTSHACKDHCCAQACGSDAECGATTCDDMGACVYPTASCGSPSCNGATAMLTTSGCRLGTCVAGAPQPCAGHFGCADGATCGTTCSSGLPCAQGHFCSAGACPPLGAPGTPCPFDAGCQSGYCGTGDATSAVCCVSACATGDDAGCGATGCDSRGICQYPGTSTVCSVTSCVGASYSTGANCDGQGHCPGTSGSCAPFACGTNGTCLTACSSNADCYDGLCGANGKCCDNFTNNTTYVDGTSTAIRACCGHSPGNGACRLLSDAVQLASESQISGMTLSVATKPADTSTVQLSYDVIVSAPGVTLPPLHIARFPGDTSTSVVVEGSGAKPVDLSGAGATQATIDNSMTLYLLNAKLSGATFAPIVQVNAGGALKLGTDGAAGSGTVSFDAPVGSIASGVAIGCQGAAGAPASIDDLSSAAAPSLQIRNTVIHLQVGDYCSVNLIHTPIFGRPTPCLLPYPPDGTGLLANGAADVTISNAKFQCFATAAVLLQNTSGHGSPTVRGNTNLIENSAVGVQCNAGTFAMTQTTISANKFGVIQATDTTYLTTGTVDLSGGGNQVTCNGTGVYPFTTTGADVVNETADAGLNARNVAWDSWGADAGHTELWSCADATFTSCTCAGAASCTKYFGMEDGADTVTLNTFPVDDTGGSLVPAGPNGPCP